MTRDDLYGLEFDWWALDADGCLGLLSSAGYGPIPELILQASPPYDDRAATKEALSILPQSTTWQEENRGPGWCNEWRELGARGVFVFKWHHWKGPYLRIIRPAVPTTQAGIPAGLMAALSPLRFDGSFQASNGIEALTEGEDLLRSVD